MDFSKYNRIVLLGSAGSGKSWLAKRIAEGTGHPLVHLDNEYWRPGWQATPKEEWLEKQKAMVAAPRWIIDGNYDSTMELRFAAADLVIFLDIGRLVCLRSVWKRHGQKRPDLPAYLEERRDREFLAFNKWIWNFPRTGRKTILALHGQYPETPFLHIKSRREAGGLAAGKGV